MGSRIGSIAILLVIGGIVAAVTVLILTLDVINTNEPDAPLMLISLDEGELVLLDEPQSITVTISAGNPIATLELFVNEQSLVSVLPAYSADRGAYIGTFVWTPARLGFADVRIAALDDQGVETERRIRVEVTDDQARVAAALRLQVLGIAPLQQFITGATIRLAISATGSQPIERFDMLVEGDRVISVTSTLVGGEYLANIDWTPNQTGETEVTIIAIDAAGREESQTIPVILLPQNGVAPEPDDEESADESEPSSPTGPESEDSGIGAAQFDAPRDGQQFSFDDEFQLNVQLSAPSVQVASALLYITPVAPDHTLGSSVLIHSFEGPVPEYRETVAEVERWITSSGSYELQLVVFTPEQDRYDARIMIHVVATATDDEESPIGVDNASQQADTSTPTASDDADLAILTARQAEDNRRQLIVSIVNASTVEIGRTDIKLIVTNVATGAELGVVAVTLKLAADDARSIPLDLTLEAGADVEALIMLESVIDTNPRNNTYRISLSGPESPQANSGGSLQEDQTSQEDDADDETSETERDAPSPSPDLTVLDVLTTVDGFVLVTVSNQGDAPAETFRIVVSDASGETLESIVRGSADSEPLPIGQSEILTSQQPHTGAITLTVLVGGAVAEQNTTNNSITVEIPE